MENDKNSQTNDQKEEKFLNKIGNKLVEESESSEKNANLNKVTQKIKR